jgi:hypothetical protein
MEIRIPTPITAHLDNCRQCADDLEAIRRLNLNCKQLRALSQLFADELSEDSAKCSEIEEIIASAASMDFGGITAEALKHLCKCPVCRDSLYQERQKMYESLQEQTLTSELSCESISATDIFDYVVPYGLDPADDQYAKFRESLTSHLRCCRTCLTKMQELHCTIYNITARAESEVVTIYHIDESAKAQALSDSDDLYACFPIRVEITGREDRVGIEQPVTTVDFTTRLKQKLSTLNVKPLLKTGLAAAAIILVGFALLLYTPTTKAVTIEQIYRAIENVKNVYISTFARDEAEPTQERWISRTLNIYISKTENESILTDVPNKVRKVKHLDAGSVMTMPLSDEMITEVEKAIGRTPGLLPFEKISDIPKNGQWSRLADDGVETIVGDTGVDVYNLTWQKYGSSVTFKWRFFVEPSTNLPLKTEFYQKRPVDTEYTRLSTTVVKYLTDSEIQVLIKDIGL